METASVSKLNGLKIKVAGNSFTTSVKTKRKLVKKLVFKRGKWILLNKFHPLDFKIFAESSIPELIFVNPYSKEEFANAYDLIKYAIKKGDLENPGRAWLLLGITRNKKGIKYENSALFAFKRSTGYEDMEADARRWVKVIESKQARREADRLAAEAAEAELADDSIYFN